MSRVDDLGAELRAAARAGTPIPPLTAGHPDLTIAEAYAIQRVGRRARLAEGATIVGHKIGLTSLAMQEMLGVDQPDFGYLTADMISPSGAALPAAAFIAPRAELEIAFRLREPLEGGALTAAEVLAATDAVAPAIEVIDSRIADWQLTIADTVADNASSGHVVLGAWRDLDGLDLRALSGTLAVEGGAAEPTTVSGRGDAVLGDPAEAVAWLARALHEYGSERIDAGEIVLSGAMARALPVGPGSVARGQIDQLGHVTSTFTQGSGQW